MLPNPFGDSPGWLAPLFFAALAVSIALLLAAALPVSGAGLAGLGPALAGRRSDLAFAGALMLGTVTIAALLLYS